MIRPLFLLLPAFSLLAPFAEAVTAGADFESRRLENWHQWRGPEASGAAPRGEPPLAWSEEKNVRWRVDLVGEGHASPIVWESLVFVVSAARTERSLEVPPPPDPRRKTEAPRHYYRFLVTAYDRGTGSLRWQRTACEEVPHEGRHETNSYASASPTSDGERLYVSFGSRGLFAYDLKGDLVWKRDLGDMRTRFGWGEGASPAVRSGTLVVNWDQEDGSFITALDAATGDPRWRKDRDEDSSWATPLLVEHGGRAQAVVNGTKRVRSYDLKTGDLIWECGGQTANAIPSPVRWGEAVICMSGYRGAAAYAIRLDARGDLTGTERVLWSFNRGTPYVPSPLLYGDRLYFTERNSPILTCLDARTGKPVFDGQRVPGLGDLYASPVGAAGRVYFADRNGTVVVLRHGGGLEVMATNRLEDRFEASPAIAGRSLFLRGRQHLYCLEEGAGEPARK